MEIRDVQQLFSHIKQLHPNCPPEKRPVLTSSVARAWVRALAGYSREQLFEAAEAHAAVCRYWPSLNELLAQLPPLPPGERQRFAPPTPSQLRSAEQWHSWQADWHGELSARGLPTLGQALAGGLTVGAWLQMLEEAGLWM